MFTVFFLALNRMLELHEYHLFSGYICASTKFHRCNKRFDFFLAMLLRLVFTF